MLREARSLYLYTASLAALCLAKESLADCTGGSFSAMLREARPLYTDTASLAALCLSPGARRTGRAGISP